MAKFNINLHGWHIKGTDNWLADQISRNTNMSNNKLSLHLYQQAKQKGQELPDNFTILSAGPLLQIADLGSLILGLAGHSNVNCDVLAHDN